MSRSAAARTPSEVPSFDVVAAVTPVGTAPCAECRGPIVDAYYESEQGVVCASCHTRLMSASSSEERSGRMSRALAFGVAAATAGAAIHFMMLAATGREVTVVALLVGFLVGKAVRTGSRGRGGRRFQWLAIALTYLAIVATYTPFVVKGLTAVSSAAAPATGGIGALLVLAAIAPLLEGLSHVMTLIITMAAFALAWRLNRRVNVSMTGPYFVGRR